MAKKDRKTGDMHLQKLELKLIIKKYLFLVTFEYYTNFVLVAGRHWHALYKKF